MIITNTSIKHSQTRSFAALSEAYAPMIAGVAGAIVANSCAPHYFAIAKKYHWHTDNLYISVFGFLIFACPFLFAYYTYVKTVDNRYISAVRHTDIFARAEQYIIRAIIFTAVDAFISIPFMIIVPEPEEKNKLFYGVVIWCGVTLYATALTIRSMYNFTSILEIAVPKRFS